MYYLSSSTFRCELCGMVIHKEPQKYSECHNDSFPAICPSVKTQLSPTVLSTCSFYTTKWSLLKSRHLIFSVWTDMQVLCPGCLNKALCHGCLCKWVSTHPLWPVWVDCFCQKYSLVFMSAYRNKGWSDLWSATSCVGMLPIIPCQQKLGVKTLGMLDFNMPNSLFSWDINYYLRCLEEAYSLQPIEINMHLWRSCLYMGEKYSVP